MRIQLPTGQLSLSGFWFIKSILYLETQMNSYPHHMANHMNRTAHRSSGNQQSETKEMGKKEERSYTCGCGRRGSRRTSRCSSGGGSCGGRSARRACASCSGAYRSCPYPSPANPKRRKQETRQESADDGG
jgi:hypothetical protein